MPSADHSGRAYAQVALPVPVENTFTYKIPQELQAEIAVGRRVEVPFGHRVLSGIVTSLCADTDIRGAKPIRSLYETYLPAPLLKITEWIASYYGCSLGEAAQSVLPPSLRGGAPRRGARGTLTLHENMVSTSAIDAAFKRAPRQRELVRRIADAGGSASVTTIREEWGFDVGLIKALVDKNIADLAQTTSTLDHIDEAVTELTADQTSAFARISEALESNAFAPVLLYGVTGSGKTEIYLRAARRVLEGGGSCIVLVPEISLLPQAVSRYRRLFGDDLAVLHSRLTGAERLEIWRRIERGACRLVLGPRSAVFSPTRNLRLIIVDEEQDDSYKQEDKPRYHARSVALMRGKFERLTVVLGSATPSAESFYHARGGRYTLLTLPSRVQGVRLPEVRFIDLREAPMSGTFFSKALLDRLEWNVENGHQSILFLNKRGHARYVLCNACGNVERCDNCDISLVYHRVAQKLRCHFCGFSRPAAQRCRACGSPKLYFAGAGTQRVELELGTLLPGVGVLRMDTDTTTGKDGHRRVIERFGSGEFPVLIGTQMVAKGHHFPGVNLVGVLLAEDSLNFPDFRSSERTFQQLTQVAGRAGRAHAGGEVIVQTFVPDHPVFTHLSSHDYVRFMDGELRTRKLLRYPPFTRIVLAVCSAPNATLLSNVVRRWTAELRRRLRNRPVDVLGPVPPPIARVRNRYREHVLIKGNLSGSDKTGLVGSFRRIVEGVRGGSSVDLRWDVDPEGFF